MYRRYTWCNLKKLCALFSEFRYGGGPVLARKVIRTGLSETELSVEVYPLRLQLHLIPKGDRSAIRISKKVWNMSSIMLPDGWPDVSERLNSVWQETIGELHRRACEIFNLIPEQVNNSLYDPNFYIRFLSNNILMEILY